ncbi:MAG TPA: hypothetical protein DD379_10360 [Cyanobacteria bacterium UBA11162]|nr:hypothetical protein [Cyanobacteria bacterium UBA11162]
MYKNLKSLGTIFIAVSLVFGLLIRVFVVLYFTNFSGDQINDAYRVMGTWEGSPPTLGPGPAAWSGLSGEIYLPPLYYYLVFPFTVFTHDLSSQAIPNAFFTFLSIPLLSIVVYKLIENINSQKRYIIAALAGIWYSFLFRNIVFSTGDSLAGNPVSIPFFMLCFILLYTYQLEGKLSPRVEILSWIAYGICLAILVSLHFSALFVMPVIFICTLVFYICRNPKRIKRWFLSGVAIVSALLVLTPYWIGEVGRSWINTRTIISLVIDASSKKGHAVTFLQRLYQASRGYLDLGKDVYFISYSSLTIAISIAFLLIVLVLGLIKFQGNKTILGLFIGTWIVFLYAYSSTNLDITYNPVFYKVLIYLAPIVLTSCSLAYLNFSKKLDKVFIGLILLGIALSILINIKYHYNYVSARSGMPRLANTSDIAHMLNQVPEKSIICDPIARYRNIKVYEYTDRYITKKQFKFVPECKPGSYLFYKKYESLGNFTKRSTKSFSEAFKEFDKKYSLFKDTPFYYIYRLDD